MTTIPDGLKADCPSCGERLWRERRGEWTLANRIVKLAKGAVVAKCPRCGDHVDVPFLQVVDPGPQPAQAHAPRRMVMRADLVDKVP